MIIYSKVQTNKPNTEYVNCQNVLSYYLAHATIYKNWAGMSYAQRYTVVRSAGSPAVRQNKGT
jgi:hypothetical protein